jgi:hypothetical protein
MPSLRPPAALAAAIPAVALLALACSTTTGLPAATFTNTVDTVSLYAARGTAIALPSAYLLQGAQAVRIDTTTTLDILFDFDSLGEPALFPTGAIRLGSLSGLQLSTTAFDAIKLAPRTAIRCRRCW